MNTMETVASAKRKRETDDAMQTEVGQYHQKHQKRRNILRNIEYEFIAVWHLAMSHTCVYHWSTIPEAVLYKAGFIHNFNEHRLNGVREPTAS